VPYGRVDDGFHAHPKRRRSSLAADGLLVRAISYASHYLTDGFVDDAWVRAQLPRRGARAVLESALSAQLLDRFPAGSTTVEVHRRPTGMVRCEVGPFTADGYLIHDYLADNLSREEVEEQRKRSRDKKRRRRSKPPADYSPAPPPPTSAGSVSPGDTPGDSPVPSPGLSRTTPLHTTETATP
jgi:hypothetical protein